jgi:hypothetical protein
MPVCFLAKGKNRSWDSGAKKVKSKKHELPKIFPYK